jgi:hypothetical protein
VLIHLLVNREQLEYNLVTCNFNSAAAVQLTPFFDSAGVPDPC